ncbi:polysaccharide pyruvyl transferase family protein [Arthrobacter sp.]|uniref:polysaccharide pyruvyl transferase family protein n=1 Tax=Arthrobacter sp. TaxID=1667 RepID=UPI003A8DDF86
MIRTKLRNARDRWQSKTLKKDLAAVRRGLESAAFPEAAKCSVRGYRASTVVLECVLEDLRIAFDVSVDKGVASLSVLGRSEDASRVLRNALIGVALNVRLNGERNILRTWPMRPKRQRVVEEVIAEIHSAMNRISTLPGELHPNREVGPTDALTYWWDTKANFGDTIGPWLVSRISGRRPVNSRWVQGTGPALFTVGSVFGHLTKPGEHVWGSGLIGPPGAAKLDQLRGAPPKRIHAVRGKKTREVLIRELGWDVPEVYGDPALLLPRYYQPKPSNRPRKIGLVPHYKHKKLFKPLEGVGVTTIDVAMGLEPVVDQIASCSAVISTSLHGIIVAQSYGIPWLWVRLEDSQLGGGAFKFEDFFSLLARDEVASLDSSTRELGDLRVADLAGRATLPTSYYDLDLLEHSFPSHLFSNSQLGSTAS